MTMREDRLLNYVVLTQGCDLFEELIHAIEWDYNDRAMGLVEEIIRTAPELLKKTDSEGRTLLIWAVAHGREEVAEFLIKNMSIEAVSIVVTGCEGVSSQVCGANVFFKAGESALMWAVSMGMLDICKLLLGKMTPEAVNFVTSDGYTALMIAAKEGDAKICRLLLPYTDFKGFNALADNGMSALHWATYNIDKEGMEVVCELLIANVSEDTINTVDEYGNTPLIYAAKKGMLGLCNALISRMGLSDEDINDGKIPQLHKLLWK